MYMTQVAAGGLYYLQVHDKFLQHLEENLETCFPDLPLIQNFAAFDLRGVTEDDLPEHGNQQIKVDMISMNSVSI